MLRIGITGGVGAGKSSVLHLLAARDIPTTDADTLARDTYRQGTDCYQQVVAHFGRDILDADGAISRAQLGKIVFASPPDLATLNHIVWPHTRERLRALMHQRSRAECPIFAAEAALLIEADWTDMFDKIWIVQTQPDIIEKRAQRSAPSADIAAVAAHQMTFSDKIAALKTTGKQYTVIKNDGTLTDLQIQVDAALS